MQDASRSNISHGGNRLFVYLAAAALAIVLIIASLIVIKPVSVAADEHITPLLFTRDGGVYIACGERQVMLADALLDNNSLYGWLSRDNSALYYLAGYDEKTGTGTLMLANTQCKNDPEKIDTEVRETQVSKAGDALYLKQMEGLTGSLYLYRRGGRPELLAEGVVSGYYGFSPGGSVVFYTTADSVYVRVNGTTTRAADANGVRHVYSGDSGKLLFESSEGIWLWSNGAVEKVSPEFNTFIDIIFGDVDEFLFEGRRLVILQNTGQGSGACGRRRLDTAAIRIWRRNYNSE